MKENASRLVTPELENKFSLVMQFAEVAKAYPSQSGFFVKTAGMTENGMYYKGGNKEYAHSHAFIHGETAVVSGLRDLTKSPIEVIGWHKKGEVTPEDFGRPCGNCRDILKEYCKPETFLINGNNNSYVVAQLNDYLFEDFNKVKPKIETAEFRSAIDALFGGNDIYVSDELKPDVYGAAIVAEDGTIWPGGLYGNVGFDSVPAILTAMQNWRWNYPTGTILEGRLRVKKVLVVGATKPPHIFYRDRQALLEFDEVLRKFTRNPEPLCVQAVNLKGEGYETNVEEMLPRPFSPGAFRMDDVMTGQLGKIIGKDNLEKLNI